MTEGVNVKDTAGAEINPAKEDGNLATLKTDLALIKADIDALAQDMANLMASDTYDLDDIGQFLGNINTRCDGIRTAVQIMDDWDESDKAKMVQDNKDSHWQKDLMSASGVIKAEESGKVVVITDVIVSNHNNGLSYGYIKYKDNSGTQICSFISSSRYSEHFTFREGIEGNAYDGSNAGDLYWNDASGDLRVTFMGYMKDA